MICSARVSEATQQHEALRCHSQDTRQHANLETQLASKSKACTALHPCCDHACEHAPPRETSPPLPCPQTQKCMPCDVHYVAGQSLPPLALETKNTNTRDLVIGASTIIESTREAEMLPPLNCSSQERAIFQTSVKHEGIPSTKSCNI